MSIETVWLAFARAAIAECERRNSTTKIVIDAVKSREELEQNFDILDKKIRRL